ncbi:MAG: SPFH domain-containing protein, partial [Planctomycetota bacterium]
MSDPTPTPPTSPLPGDNRDVLTPRPMGTSDQIAAAAAQAEQLGDDAGKSLADALRISFKVLRLVIFLLIILFLFSGFFYVDSNQVAVRTRFGKITQDNEGRGYLTAEAGPYFRFPAPIDEITYVPTTTQTVEINDAFWYGERGREGELQPDQATQTSLRAGIDGSLITGDGNLVHGRFTVNFRVKPEDAVTFVKALGGDPDDTAPMVRAQRMVTIAAERAISAAAAEVGAIEFLQSSANTALMRSKLEEVLTLEMNTGITVETVIADQRVAPPGVQQSFAAVQTATAERQSALLKAQQDRNSRLSEAAGGGYGALLAVLDIYGDAERDEEPELRAAAANALDAMLDGVTAQSAIEPLLPLVDEAKREQLTLVATPVEIGGQAREIINAAEQY